MFLDVSLGAAIVFLSLGKVMLEKLRKKPSPIIVRVRQLWIAIPRSAF